MDEKWKKFVREKYHEYKKIRYVECPAFDNEKVYFNKYGFDHLIRKGRKLRIKSEQKRRLSLFINAPKIISTSIKFTTKFESLCKEPATYFWSFVFKKERMNITVIVRQLDFKNKHFFSIFDSPDLS